MGRHEHYEDRSSDSAFLEAFRKRKNERLMSELELSGDNDVSEDNYSRNYRSSAYNQPTRDAHRPNSAQFAENQSYQRQTQGNRSGEAVRSNPEPIHEEYLPPLPSNNVDGANERLNSFDSVPFDSMNDDFEEDMDLSGAGASTTSSMESAPMDSDISEFSDMQSDTADYSAVNKTSDSKRVEKKTSDKTSSKSHGADTKKGKGKKGIFIFLLLILIACVVIYVIKQNQKDITVDPYDTASAVSSYEKDPFVFSSDVSSDEVSSAISDPTSSLEDVSSVTSSDPTIIPDDIALTVGSEGDEVMKLQKRLCELGYLSKESCTGYFGNFTKKRVQMFQEYAKMKQTGIADKKTLERLYADDAPYCK